LTVEKGFAAITVQDLADRAMVNRSTFYRHFLDKYDLLDAYMDGVYARSNEEEFLAEKLGTQPKDAPSGLLVLLRLIQQDADFFRVMLGPQGDAYLVGRMRDHTEQRFRNLLTNYVAEQDPAAPPVGMRIRYIAYAGIGAITWWLDHLDECSAEEMARWMGELSGTAAGLNLNEFLRRANSLENNPPLNMRRNHNGD
jgi:AcrR family transcriptional regulator